MNRPARHRVLIGAAALALLLAGCGGDDEPTDADDSPSGASSDSPTATTAGALDFATVESLTASRFQSDKNCAVGVWGENSTGVPDEFAGAVTFFRQFDCYRNEGQIGGFPERGQQSIYVEFGDAETATAYVEDTKILYPTLLDDTRVVVAGTGLKSVDMDAYLADLQAACGCGEVVPSQY